VKAAHDQASKVGEDKEHFSYNAICPLLRNTSMWIVAALVKMKMWGGVFLCQERYFLMEERKAAESYPKGLSHSPLLRARREDEAEDTIEEKEQAGSCSKLT